MTIFSVGLRKSSQYIEAEWSRLLLHKPLNQASKLHFNFKPELYVRASSTGRDENATSVNFNRGNNSK